MEKKDAPKKNAESHRGKKVAPKNEEKQLRRPPKKTTVSPRKNSLAKEKKSRDTHKKKTVSLSNKSHAPPQKKQLAPKKITRQKEKNTRAFIYSYAYVCGTNICVLISASKDLVYALKSKVRQCLVFYSSA